MAEIRVLGLDLSTKAGIAVCSGDPTTGDRARVVHTLRPTFPKLSGMARVNAIASTIQETIAEYKPAFVIAEGYAVSKFGGAVIALHEVGAVVRFFLWQEELPYFDVSPTTIKKFVMGSGAASKDQMILGVFKKYDYTPATNDEADAVGLAMFGLALAGVRFSLPDIKVAKDIGRKNEWLAQVDTIVAAQCN